MLATLQKKSLTEDGRARKDRIVEILHYKSVCTQLTLELYKSALHQLKAYVCLFQTTTTPLVHKSHDEQEKVLRNFLSCFIKAEYLVDLSSSHLKVFDLKDRNVYMKPHHMFVGATCKQLIKSHIKSPYIKDFYNRVEEAYTSCAAYLQNKLPLDNSIIKSLSAIDPAARGHSATCSLMKNLQVISAGITDTDLDQYEQEVQQYNVDGRLPKYESEKKRKN